jgi:ankyrin repeat protein
MSKGYLAQVQALIDEKFKDNPEELKRIMEFNKEVYGKEKPKEIIPNLEATKYLIEELNKCNLLDIKRVKELIQMGANIKAKNKWNTTVLHEAVRNNDYELIHLCLNNGMSIEEKDDFEETPLSKATTDDMVTFLKEYKEK